MHRFNFTRPAAVLVTALVVLAACAQGPGYSRTARDERTVHAHRAV